MSQKYNHRNPSSSDATDSIAQRIDKLSSNSGRDRNSWESELLRSDRGTLKPLLANGITVLRHEPVWSGVIEKDAFADEIILASTPPWHSLDTAWIRRAWTAGDDIRTANWLQRYGIDVTPQVASQAVNAVAEEHQVHPVLNYLSNLRWDEKPRVDNWIQRYLGGEDSNYHRHVGRCSLIAAIARIRQPGCKVDTMPILEGKQGRGKSSALEVLFGNWFSDELADLGTKDAAMQTRGAWGIEISELDAMSRPEVGRIKAFVSRTTDRFRPPYSNRVVQNRRSCVFWGTTNADNYLKDETGGRRFWPIKTKSIDLQALRMDRDQLWAEAQHLFQTGESWWLKSAELGKAAAEEQQSRYAGDPWDSIIAVFIATRTRVTIEEILKEALNLQTGLWGQSEMNRAARSLKSQGWIRRQRREQAKKRRYFYEPDKG